MRTLVEIPDDQIQVLDTICKSERISRAEAIRSAISIFITKKANIEFDRAIGSWKDVEIDSVELQRSLREDRD